MFESFTAYITANPKVTLLLLAVLIVIIVYLFLEYRGIFGIGPWVVGGAEVKHLVAKINKVRGKSEKNDSFGANIYKIKK